VPTPSEGRALLFVAAVAALGLGVRGCRVLRAPEAPQSDREALARQIAVVDSALTSGGRRRSAASATPQATAPGSGRATPPAAPAGPVDLDRASAAELDALPGIGPALAARIVADREANGAFGSLEALQEVRGIGPALAARLAPLITFSSPPRTPRPGAKMRP
jgi:competence protein ComEA